MLCKCMIFFGPIIFDSSDLLHFSLFFTKLYYVLSHYNFFFKLKFVFTLFIKKLFTISAIVVRYVL